MADTEDRVRSSFRRPLCFYTPLLEHEKPGMLEAVSRGWGCDDPHVLNACYTLVRMKQLQEKIRDAFEATQRAAADKGRL